MNPIKLHLTMRNLIAVTVMAWLLFGTVACPNTAVCTKDGDCSSAQRCVEQQCQNVQAEVSKEAVAEATSEPVLEPSQEPAAPDEPSVLDASEPVQEQPSMNEEPVVTEEPLTNSPWAAKAGGTGRDGGESISVDTQGNVVVTGYFAGEVAFGESTLSAKGNRDIFVTKMAPSGKFLWAKRVGGASFNRGSTSFNNDRLGLDNQDNVYIVVTYQSQADVGGTTLSAPSSRGLFVAKWKPDGTFQWVKTAVVPGDRDVKITPVPGGGVYVSGVFNAQAVFEGTTLTSKGGNDIFVAKWGDDGSVLWAKRAGSSSFDGDTKPQLDNKGNLYLSGVIQGEADMGSVTLTSAGAQDVFVAKFDPNGAVVWAKRMGGGGPDGAGGVAVDSQGNVYVTGNFLLEANFGSTTLTSKGSFDWFLAKWNNTGNFQWVKQVGGAETDSGTTLVTGPQDNIYVMGRFNKTIEVAGTTFTVDGRDNVFLTKLDPKGNFIWARHPKGVSLYLAPHPHVDTKGNFFLVGNLRGKADFGGTTVTSNNADDAIVVKWSPSGAVVWAKNAGGLGSDRARRLSLDTQGNIFVTGEFERSVDFGGTTLSSKGGVDMFVWKLQ